MSRKKIFFFKKALLDIEKERSPLIRSLFSDVDLVEGSYRPFYVRCGKPGCHCEENPCHFVTRLSVWQKGKLKNKVVRVADREWVKERADNYKAHKRVLTQLAKLNQKERKTIKALMKLKIVQYK